MKVSFVIPLYNGLHFSQAMLASLQATLPAGLAHEILFVDDGSTDDTRTWLKNLAAPCRSLLNEKNLGFAATCNRGAAEATGEFLFFLNNDLVLLPRWLEPILAVFADHPDAGVVGNVQRNAATDALDHVGLTFNAKGKPEHLTSRDWRRRRVRPVVAVTGACCAIRRTSWLQLGGFDEAYINGCEDVDLSLRAIALGHANYVATTSIVRHHISASPGRKLRDEHNTARLLRRWRFFIQPRITRAVARTCLAASWEEPRNYADQRLVFACVLHVAHLLRRPTPGIMAATSSALDLETDRWAVLLENAHAREPREIAPALFPIIPEDPPVL